SQWAKQLAGDPATDHERAAQGPLIQNVMVPVSNLTGNPPEDERTWLANRYAYRAFWELAGFYVIHPGGYPPPESSTPTALQPVREPEQEPEQLGQHTRYRLIEYDEQEWLIWEDLGALLVWPKGVPLPT